MQRISKVTSAVVESYAGFIGLVQTSPSRRGPGKIVPLAELSGQFLTFYMHTSAGHADVFTDAFVTNPNNLPQDQLQRAAGLAHNLMVDTVRTAAQAAADDSPRIARRASLAALDANMPPARADLAAGQTARGTTAAHRRHHQERRGITDADGQHSVQAARCARALRCARVQAEIVSPNTRNSWWACSGPFPAEQSPQDQCKPKTLQPRPRPDLDRLCMSATGSVERGASDCTVREEHDSGDSHDNANDYQPPVLLTHACPRATSRTDFNTTAGPCHST